MAKEENPEIKYVVDRKNWGPVEWDGEPDEYEVRYHGYKITLIRGYWGHSYGYVGVPIDSKWAQSEDTYKTMKFVISQMRRIVRKIQR